MKVQHFLPFALLGITMACSERSEPQPAVAPSLANARAAAAVFCQCTKYINNATGVKNPEKAQDYGANLVAAGYKKVAIDWKNDWGGMSGNDIIVINGSYGGGVNPTYGHVGKVDFVTTNRDKNKKIVSFTIKVRGANQTNDPKKIFTEWGCSNVDVNMTVTLTTTQTAIAIYRK